MEKQIDLPGLHTEKGLSFLWSYLLAHGHDRSAMNFDRDSMRFLGHCLGRFAQSRAHLLQDLYATYKLGEAQPGFFVEFGAMDGVFFSNTHYLEKVLGWRGILAEPFPRWRDDLRANRGAKIDYRCVWSESGGTLEFIAANRYPELSSLAAFAANDAHAEARRVDAQTILVQTVSLTDLLTEHEAPATIDYLSVDTEGSEYEILSNFDFSRFSVRVLTVEHNFQDDARASLRHLLEGHGFKREFEAFSGADDWYFHPDRV